jgi:lipopolysaccharide/colanic/teichoic acid biosynthesis glycosyltransferase
VLVLGEGPIAARVVEAVDAKVRGEEVGEHIIVGVIDLTGDGAGGYAQIDEALRSARPDRIVVAAVDRQVPLPLRQLLEGRLHGIAVEDWVPFYERLAGKTALESLTPVSVAFGDGFGEARLHAAFARAVGLVATLIGLTLLAPFLLLVALAIRITSPGPIFFVQPRVGRYGRPYGLIKLRTMHVTTKAPSEWAQDNDYRITPIGRWLRRFRIDELPQLINVLKGDMNVVGPRPHPVSNYLPFMDRIPHYALRSVVRPGITGWAQVRYGYANNLEQEIEKMCFDLFYIRNVSIWLDLRVLLETVRVVARGHEGIDFGMLPVQTELSGPGHMNPASSASGTRFETAESVCALART